MSNTDVSRLDLTTDEKRKFREHKIKIDSIHLLGVRKIQSLLDVSKIRAMEISALSEFQSLPSIGPRFAHDLISMGYYSLRSLKTKNGARLTDSYERQIGVWADPCVEDQFRLIVHYANHPNEHRNWWDFTAERKVFRAKHGYPNNRPTKAWHELPRYNRFENVVAAKEDTKMALASGLKESARYMNKHYREKLSLKQLARVAAVSPHHYLRQFKNVYEITPLQYLTNIRMKRATRLLKTTDLPIAEIGGRCSFENESAFIRLFKKQLFKTPLSFRMELRKKAVKR